MRLHARIFIVVGSLSAAASVALGAAASHALAGRLAGTLAWFEAALQYQQFHALGLLAVGLLADRISSRWLAVAGWLMIAGTLLFSGNLYLRSLLDFHDLHAATPFGGGAFMLAWIALAIGAMSASGRDGVVG